MRKIIICILLSICLLLVACGSGNPDTAVQYLEALNARDLETAQTLVCEARQDDVTMGLTSVTDDEEEAFTFENISCSPEGSNVSCRYTIDQNTENLDVGGVQQTHDVVFEFEGGKVCGFEEQVAQ